VSSSNQAFVIVSMDEEFKPHCMKTLMQDLHEFVFGSFPVAFGME
jgi:hypothetical protein